MSNKELTKEDLKNLSHDDLIRLGASLAIKHVVDSLEKMKIQRKRKKNETLFNWLLPTNNLLIIYATVDYRRTTESLASISR